MNISHLRNRIRCTEPPVQPDIKRIGTDYQEEFVIWNPFNIKNGSIFSQFTVNADTDQTLYLIPDACAGIVFNCDISNANAQLSGIYTYPHEVILQNKATFFCFKPYTLMGTKLGDAHHKELLNSSIDIRDIFSNTDIADRIAEAPSFYQRIELFQSFAMEKMLDEKYDNIAEYMAIIMCLSNGKARMSEIEDLMGFTEKYCRKKFNAEYGFSPKLYERMCRLQKSIGMMSSMKAERISMQDLTYESGYFDQSHFIREFKMYTNMTPTQFMRTYFASILE